MMELCDIVLHSLSLCVLFVIMLHNLFTELYSLNASVAANLHELEIFLCFTQLAHRDVHFMFLLSFMCCMFVLLTWFRGVAQAGDVTQEEELRPLESLPQQDEGER